MALIHTVLLSIFVAWLFSPWWRVQLNELPVAGIEEWAAKGDAPALPGFPPHLAGLYYLHQNIVPSSKALSSLTHLDFTHCDWVAEERSMYFYM